MWSRGQTLSQSPHSPSLGLALQLRVFFFHGLVVKQAWECPWRGRSLALVSVWVQLSYLKFRSSVAMPFHSFPSYWSRGQAVSPGERRAKGANGSFLNVLWASVSQVCLHSKQ